MLRSKLVRRLAMGLGLGFAALAGGLYWSARLPEQLAPGPTPAEPFVKLVDIGEGAASRALAERAMLLDPTPLFLPTSRNYGQEGLPAAVNRQPGRAFGDYEAKHLFPDKDLNSFFKINTEAPASLAEVLALGNEVPFAGLGEQRQERDAVADFHGVGRYEVKSLSGNIIKSLSLVDWPKMARSDFAPVEFLLTIGRDGMVGEPVMTRGTGWDEVDVSLRRLVRSGLGLGVRLGPGQYWISIGP